jgi:hypothetical protein
VKYTDIFVACPPENIQYMLQQVFYANQFNVLWYSPDSGRAHRGSRDKYVFWGALSQYYEIDFRILTLPDKSYAIRLIRSNTGLWGGVIGVMNVNKQFEDVAYMLSNYFNSYGLYRGRVSK